MGRREETEADRLERPSARREDALVIKVYGYMPAWSVPCVSPFVTKVVNYLKMTEMEFEFVRQDLARLDIDAPHGKLPMIEDDGDLIADSTQIIQYLKAQHGDPLDSNADARELAQMAAFNRLIDEHLYWTAIIQPRWRESENWERHLKIFAGQSDVPAAFRTFFDDFRHRVLSAFMTGGWGRMSAEQIYLRAREDIDAIANQLGDRPYLMGYAPRSIDAGVSSILRHIIDAPFASDTKDYAAGKANLKDYLSRMKEKFDI